MTNDKNRATGDAQDGQQRAPQVGALLKASRLRVGEDLRDVAEVLCIRYLYLEAIEECRYGDLPGVTYAVGFIRSYADHLGLDGEEVVRRFRAEQAGVNRKNDLFFPTPVTEGGVPKGAIVFVGVLLALVAYGAWYASTNDDGFFASLISPVPEHLSGKPAPDAKPGEQAPATTTMTPSEAAKTEEKPAETATQLPSTPADAGTQVAQGAGETPKPAEPTPAAEVPKPVETAPKPAEAPKPATTTPATTTPAPTPITPVKTPTETVEENQETATPEPTRAASNAPTSAVPRTPAPTPAAGSTVPKPALPPAASSRPVTEQASAAVVAAGAGIVLKANAASYIEVVDPNGNQVVHSGLLNTGASYKVPRGGLILNTGNAGALDILVDGVRVPSVGGDGDVRRGIALDGARLKSGTAVP